MEIMNIVGYNGKYEIDMDGNVFSYCRSIRKKLNLNEKFLTFIV